MKFKSRITKYGKIRKIIEVPAKIRDLFKVGEEVQVIKKQKRIRLKFKGRT